MARSCRSYTPPPPLSCSTESRHRPVWPPDWPPISPKPPPPDHGIVNRGNGARLLQLQPAAPLVLLDGVAASARLAAGLAPDLAKAAAP